MVTNSLMIYALYKSFNNSYESKFQAPGIAAFAKELLCRKQENYLPPWKF